MDRSLSSEGNIRLQRKNIPCLLQNRKVQYDAHNISPLALIQGQVNTVHTLIQYFL
jgi:hypothetical protein